MMAFDVLLFAVITVFLFIKLRSVLGTRTGFEKQDLRARILKDIEGVVEVQAKAAMDLFLGYEESIRQGLVAIQTVSRIPFDDKKFLKGAEFAFEEIMKAFANQNRDRLKALLDKSVYEAFDKAISDREALGHKLETTIVAIKAKDIVGAGLNKNTAEITVRFVSEQVNITKDASDAIVEGSAHTTDHVTDVWTFVRDATSKNPNWKLHKTATEV